MSEPIVIPAIIPQSLVHLRESIEKLGGFTREIQIDIVDGVFVRDTSWPYLDAAPDGDRSDIIAQLAESIPQGLSFELDLMVHDPLRTLPLWLSQHPKRIVLHIESLAADADVTRAIEMTRAGGSAIVLCAMNDTPLARVLAFAPQIDGVQCMGIKEIGRQGNHFDMRVLERVERIRHACPELLISVDGSVNRDTIVALKAAGANRFVAGSAIFGAALPARAHAELQYLLKLNE